MEREIEFIKLRIEKLEKEIKEIKEYKQKQQRKDFESSLYPKLI